ASLLIDERTPARLRLSPENEALLSEAQRIAEGLTEEQAETVSLAEHGSYPLRFVTQSARRGAQSTALVDGLRALGLMDDCPISDRPRQTPLGKLVAALRERQR